MKADAATPRIAVWDPLIRVLHWALLIAFAIAYLSGEEERDPGVLHAWSGYAVGLIVVLRVLWGVVGTQHARFSDFVTGPGSALRYLRDLIGGGSRRYLGHSPAGGAMVIALLLFLALTVTTGLLAYGDRGKGPFASQAVTAITQGRAGDEEESLAGELHGAFANITLALIVLHILGVGLASFAHRESLVKAMITGEKRANSSTD